MSAEQRSGSGSEQKFSQSELDTHAEDLLGQFRTALGASPEFTQALTENYFKGIATRRPVSFQRDRHKYNVTFEVVENIHHYYGEILEVDKTDPDTSLVERVSISVGKREGFTSRINYSRVHYGTSDRDSHEDNDAAVTKSKDFLAEFGGQSS